MNDKEYQRKRDDVSTSTAIGITYLWSALLVWVADFGAVAFLILGGAWLLVGLVRTVLLYREVVKDEA